LAAYALPFFLAIISIGSLEVFSQFSKRKILKYVTVIGIIFFPLWGVFKIAGLYSSDNSEILSCRKGYNYDLMANRLILSYNNIEQTERMVVNYPLENKSEAYRNLGVVSVISSLDNPQKFHILLNELPSHYANDFVYGAVKGTLSVSEEDYQPFKEFLETQRPEMFYSYWGSINLPEKYYGLFFNRNKLLNEMPSSEKWFYKSFLTAFWEQINSSADDLIKEISSFPSEYQEEVVKGIGISIGKQMLYDTLSSPDYPLTSSFGMKLENTFQIAFYEGIGRGFSDTLCLFLKTILSTQTHHREQLIATEQQRCFSLITNLPKTVQPIIIKGLNDGLQDKHLSSIFTEHLKPFRP
jgi:hypothetical protein